MKSGWTTKKLGEVCEEIRERISSAEIPLAAYITTDNMLKNCAGVCEAENLPPKICSLVAYQSGDILLSNIRPYLKKIWLADRSGGASSDVIVLRPRFENILARYIYRALARDEFFDFSMLNVTGTKMPRGKRDWIKSFDIPIPPLAEQKRIVAKIDAAFEKIDRLKTNAEKNLANAKELFQSALDEAMRPKKGCEYVLLPSVSERIFAGGDKPEIVFKEPTETVQIPVYSNGENNDGLYGYTDNATVTKPAVTISARGTIGYCSIRRVPYVPIVRLISIIPNDRIILEYLYYCLRSLKINNTGSSIPQLTVPMIKDLKFPLPPPYEQQRLAKQLDSLSQKTKALQQNYERQIADCAEMRQAILREAFEGRL